jgi:hypothetical protein
MLLAAPGEVNMIGAQRDMRRNAQRDRRIDPRDLFHQDRIVDVVVPRAAQILREHRAQHAQAPQGAKHRDRELLRLVPLHDVRPDLGLGELADCFSKLMLLCGESEVHYEKSSFLGSQRMVRPWR